MGGHDDSGSSKEKSTDALNDLPTFNAENMQSNMKVIYYSRTFMSIIGGVVAGILGFTGLMGFIFYFLVMAITSAGLAAKAGFSVHSYFDSWNRIILDGFLGGLLSFVLFWTHVRQMENLVAVAVILYGNCEIGIQRYQVELKSLKLLAPWNFIKRENPVTNQ